MSSILKEKILYRSIYVIHEAHEKNWGELEMDQQTGQDTKEVLLGMYKEANQMLTEKVRQLSIENASLKKQLSSQDVCTL